MTITAKALLGVLIAMTLISAWMFRYSAERINPYATLVLDRWTGKVWSCGLRKCAPVFPPRNGYQ